MWIGRRSRRNRPRNDLDDYLDEVRDRLFCVTRADRRCLLNDLKAHVREITTDPANADRFPGRYLITREQLEEEVGEPGFIAEMYMVSVSHRVPSLGLRLFIASMVVAFIGITLIGADRIDLAGSVDNQGWFYRSGIGLTTFGALACCVTLIAWYRFEKMHLFLPFLAVFLLLASIPISVVLAGELTRDAGITSAAVLQNLFELMIVIDFIFLVLLGLYVYLQHFQVMSHNEMTMV